MNAIASAGARDFAMIHRDLQDDAPSLVEPPSPFFPRWAPERPPPTRQAPWCAHYRFVPPHCFLPCSCFLMSI